MEVIPRDKVIAKQKLQPVRDYILREFDVDVYKNTQYRQRKLVDLRMLYFAVARETTKYPLDVIGSTLNKDHSTVLHALKSFIDFGYNDFKTYYDECLLLFKDTEDENFVVNYGDVDYVRQVRIKYEDLKAKYDDLKKNSNAVNDILSKLKNKSSMEVILTKLNYMVMAENNKSK